MSAQGQALAGVCFNGHPMTPDNIITGNGGCKACYRKKWREYSDKKRAWRFAPEPPAECPNGHPLDGDNLFQMHRRRGDVVRLLWACHECTAKPGNRKTTPPEKCKYGHPLRGPNSQLVINENVNNRRGWSWTCRECARNSERRRADRRKITSLMDRNAVDVTEAKAKKSHRRHVFATLEIMAEDYKRVRAEHPRGWIPILADLWGVTNSQVRYRVTLLLKEGLVVTPTNFGKRYTDAEWQQWTADYERARGGFEGRGLKAGWGPVLRELWGCNQTTMIGRIDLIKKRLARGDHVTGTP